MRNRPIAIAAAMLCLFSLNARPQSNDVPLAADANHFLYWLGTQHLQDYTEWWYFNVYDSSRHVQAIFSYLINNPFSLQGGFLPIGVSEMAAVAFTGSGTVTESDLFLTWSFSAAYDKANVQIDPQNAITVLDPNTYQVKGATRDGRIVWNLRYERAASSWFAADKFSVAAESWQLMSWLLYMPRASVTGTLTVDGKTYDVNAPGYHDHNWGEWNLNRVPWNWAQYSERDFTFDLGDFPNKPGGIASIEVSGQRFVFDRSQYTLTHTQWAYDSVNKLPYPTQSIFQAANRAAQVLVVMDVEQTVPLSAPIPPPKAVIYEQTTTYSGRAWINGKPTTFRGSGFKEYTGIVQASGTAATAP